MDADEIVNDYLDEWSDDFVDEGTTVNDFINNLLQDEVTGF